MKINKFKSLSIAVCCFVIALLSGSQGMDDLTGIEETGIGPTRMHATSPNEIDGLGFKQASSQAINYQNYSGYFSSYLFSQLESTSQLANNFAALAMNHPRVAAVVVLAHLVPTATALCECFMCLRPATDGKECLTWRQPEVVRWISRNPAECSITVGSNLTLCVPYPK